MPRAWYPRAAPRRAPRRECAICGKRFPLYLIKDGGNNKSYTRRQTCSRRCASDLASTAHERRWEQQKRTPEDVERRRQGAIRGAAKRREEAAARYTAIAAMDAPAPQIAADLGLSLSTVYRAKRILAGGNR